MTEVTGRGFTLDQNRIALFGFCYIFKTLIFSHDSFVDELNRFVLLEAVNTDPLTIIKKYGKMTHEATVGSLECIYN